jgi:hypothetical protein
MESWLGSSHRNRFGKQISKDTCRYKEIEKASDMQNRDSKTRLRDRVGVKIEKKSRGMLERCKDLFRIRKWFEISTPFLVELPVVGNLTWQGRLMPEACRVRRCTPCTNL